MIKSVMALMLLGGVASAQSHNEFGEQKSTEVAPDTRQAPMAMEDSTFAKRATEAGLFEVKLARMAMEKSKNDQVREFARRLIDDHMKANDELKRIALKKNMTLPMSPNEMQKATLERLYKLSGEEFDRSFMEENMRAHEDAVRLFKNASMMAKDPEIKNFATKTLPTLEQHGQMAERQHQKM